MPSTDATIRVTENGQSAVSRDGGAPALMLGVLAGVTTAAVLMGAWSSVVQYHLWRGSMLDASPTAARFRQNVAEIPR